MDGSNELRKIEGRIVNVSKKEIEVEVIQAKEEEKRQALAALRARQKTELADWESVRNTEDVMALERFLSKYSSGTFSDLARAKLKVVRQ